MQTMDNAETPDLATRVALAFEGAFMRPVVEHGLYYEVETDHGTQIIPADVISGSGPVDVAELLTYCEGTPDALEAEEGDPDRTIVPKIGYLARVSASGYMDCSDWSAHETEAEAYEHLIEMYGDE